MLTLASLSLLLLLLLLLLLRRWPASDPSQLRRFFNHAEEVAVTQGEGNQEDVETESEEEKENVSRLLKLYLVCSSQS